MVLYQLHYFENVGGRGELIRLLFIFAGIAFEDVPIKHSNWPALKPTYPNGQLPVLFEDGKVLAQSLAIARHVARKADLVGKNDWEMAQADAFVDITYDVMADMKTRGINKKIVEGNGTEVAEELKEALKPYLERIEKHLKTTNGVNLVGDHLTWADFAIADLFKRYSFTNVHIFDGFQTVKKFVDHVHNLPKVKEHVAKRTLKYF